jgi:hypothetical protein
MEPLLVKSSRLLFFSLISAVLATSFKMIALIVLRKASRLTHEKIRTHLGMSCTRLRWDRYEQALIQAEDHRFHLHHGVDYIALTRAVHQTFFRNCRQGGSTIEQQLVRTLTGDYRRCYRRKLRELLIASTIAGSFSKQDVLRAYLSVAYFGTDIFGLEQAIIKITIPKECSDFGAAYLIAHLRYPMPKFAKDYYYSVRLRRMLRTAHNCRIQLNSSLDLTRYRNGKLLPTASAAHAFPAANRH